MATLKLVVTPLLALLLVLWPGGGGGDGGPLSLAAATPLARPYADAAPALISAPARHRKFRE